MAEFSWNMDPSLTDVCGLEDWVPACAVYSRSRGAMSLIPSLAVDRVGNKSQDNVPRGQRQKRYATYCFAQPRCPMLRWSGFTGELSLWYSARAERGRGGVAWLGDHREGRPTRSGSGGLGSYRRVS
jgi:hypothetical protein